ncbi:hypothetical protein ACIP4U_31775 [Streptomyces caelestis]|jgi:hypothetical protein|uniref:Uncharacterized protein n=1 Tax=Streptomyces caelestis TaxID=36816 RepID=A0A7W9H5H0_9ACTN|nr:hypothetical protein [Streptomyces caelestis]MBB5795960.1 hypothetical protein [Streptomyces caelestis]
MPQDDAPLDGAAIRTVRPYLLAHEQRQRRRELAVAERAGAGAMTTPDRAVAGPYCLHVSEAA